MNFSSQLTWADLGETYDGPHATPQRVNSGPYFLNISSLSGGRLDLAQSDHVTSHEFAKWTRRVTPQAEDLLFSYETRLGEAALMPGNIEACLGRRMALLRPNRNVVHPRFMLYYYLSPAFQQIIEQNTIYGATVNRISLSTIGRWPVSIPCLKVQQAIAEVLGALDDKITATDQIAKTADTLATALAQEAFSGSRAVALEDIAVITMGSSPKGETLNEAKEGSVFYQGIRDFGLRYPDRRVWTTSPIRVAQTSDTLLSVRAPVGSVNIAPESLCIGRGLASIRSKHSTPYSLFHAIKNSPVWEQYNGEGTVFGTINRKQLAAAQINWVATEQLTELEEILKPLEMLIRQTLEVSKMLSTTRDILLPQLMSGKLRVKDAEALVESVV